MEFFSEIITIHTADPFDIHDLTESVEDFLKRHSAHNGLVNVYTTHTTTALKINESEKGFFQDLKRILFEELCSPEKEYVHNDLSVRDPKTMCPIKGHECLNGHSHVAQMLLGSASETIPVENGKMRLGRWQRILFFELDQGRERTVIVSFTGNCV